MKKKVLALIVPALLVSGAAGAAEVYNKDGNKLNIYGKAQGLYYFTNSNNADYRGDRTHARIGAKGETALNESLTGYGQWEVNFYADRAESESRGPRTRVAFAGLKFGDIGSLDYGRNYGVVYDVESYTDVLPEFGGDAYTYNDNYMTGRANSLLTWRNNDFFGLVEGLNLALQYQAANERASEYDPSKDTTTADGKTENAPDYRGTGTHTGGNRALYKDNGDGWGMSVSYDFDFGLSLATAFSSSDRTHAQVHSGQGGADSQFAGGNRAEAWTLGAKYDANNIYLAAMYAETRNMTPYGDDAGIANVAQNFEIVAMYQFDFGLQPSIAYIQSRGKKLGGIAKDKNGASHYTDKDLVKYLDIGANYQFNKNMNVYVDYMINLLDNNDTFYKDNGFLTDNIFAVGLVYRF